MHKLYLSKRQFIRESIHKGGGFFDELLAESFVWEKGYYSVPKTPAIGADLKMSAIEKYKV
jgi:L-alanine-DL-glutamate epimerase-like enolase superfamily enzyme